MVSSILLEMNNVFMQCPFLSREFLKRLRLSRTISSVCFNLLCWDSSWSRYWQKNPSTALIWTPWPWTGKDQVQMKNEVHPEFRIGNLFNKLQLFLQIFPHFWEKCFQNTKCFGAKANVIDFLTTFAQTCQHEWQILPFVWWIFLTRAKHLAKCLHSALESHTNWNQYTGKYCHFVGKNGRVWCLTNFLPCWQFLQQN